jgi:acyl-homoserine-lactone acylase
VQGPDAEVTRWERQAQNVTIVRDTWGIAHVYGKTDADAVFGVIYAQSEDDFNRVETNFINGMGRLAEAEGEKEIWRDLRMKLFVDPADMKAKYESSPAWLKTLMTSWADGLNYYLRTHPSVTPRAIKRFEPWMALTFTEGSIGGDVERVNLPQLEVSAKRRQQIAPHKSGLNETAVGRADGVQRRAIDRRSRRPKHAMLLVARALAPEAQMVSGRA